MNCEMCKEKADVRISWPASNPQSANVCEFCAAIVWNKISTDFSGTDAFAGFCIDPIYKHNR